MSDRRDALKIIGAISSTCAFPYSADELYGQHAHQAPETPAATSLKPAFFNSGEMELITRLTDLIIPATDTPGAVAAGVPLYIDYVVSSNTQWQKLYRQGLAWLDKQAHSKNGKRFLELTEDQQIAILTPLCDAADQVKPPAYAPNRKRAKGPHAPMEIAFFKALKSMTADGFFTSKGGLIETLGYKGNSVLAEFPVCTHEH